MKTLKPSQCAAVAVVIAGAALAQQASAACFMVYGQDQQMVYRSIRPPVDLSQQIHQTLPKVAPGGVLVFTSNEQGCEIEINLLEKPAIVKLEGEGVKTISPRRGTVNRS